MNCKWIPARAQVTETAEYSHTSTVSYHLTAPTFSSFDHHYQRCRLPCFFTHDKWSGAAAFTRNFKWNSTRLYIILGGRWWHIWTCLVKFSSASFSDSLKIKLQIGSVWWRPCTRKVVRGWGNLYCCGGQWQSVVSLVLQIKREKSPELMLLGGKVINYTSPQRQSCSNSFVKGTKVNDCQLCYPLCNEYILYFNKHIST